ALKTVKDLLDRFDDANIPESTTALKTIIESSTRQVSKAKLLLMELLLAASMKKFNEKKTSEHVAELKALIGAHSIFMSGNDLGLTSADLYPLLWQSVQQWVKEHATA
ncbi:unnamed protein product, partial [Symbiodinium sp. CCMP2592]